MSESTFDPPENLRQQSDWLRALARRLVGDAARADDLAQEVWLAALANQRGVRAGRSWLFGVLRNLVRDGRRSDARRALHEARVERPGAAPASDDVIDAAQRGRALTDLVLQLEEPFRTTVLLRYYEDLAPRHIASRLGIPVKTVDSRLQRGVARLRERWQRAHADERTGWHALCVIALGPGLRPAVAAGAVGLTSLGVVGMSLKWALAAGVLLGTSGLVWWIGRDRESGPLVLEAREQLTPPAATLEREPELQLDASQGLVATGATRESSHAAEAPEGPAPGVTRYGTVRSATTELLADVALVLQVYGQTRQHPVSGADGRFAFQEPQATAVIRAKDPELVTVFEGVASKAVQVEPLVVVAPALQYAGRVVDRYGAALAGAEIRWRAPEGFVEQYDVVFDGTRVREWRATSGSDGAFALHDVPRIPGAELHAQLEGFASSTQAAPLSSDATLVAVLERTQAAGDLRGKVLDQNGRAVHAARVSLGGRSATTDGAGEFRISRAGAPDARVLKAVQRGALPGRYHAALDAAGRPQWPDYIVLALGGEPLTIRGRVLDAQGEPRPHVRLWLADPTAFGVIGDDTKAQVEFVLALPPEMRGEEEPSRSYWLPVRTDSKGDFEIKGLLPQAYVLRCLEPETFQVLLSDPIEAGSEGVELVLPEPRLERVSGTVVSESGAPVSGVHVELYAWCFGGISTGLAGGARTTDEGGRFQFERIAGERRALSLRGDAILPQRVPLPDDGPLDDLVLEVQERCHFKVDLGLEPELADSVAVRDAEDNELNLRVISPDGVWTTNVVPLSAGRSSTIGVSRKATSVVLLKDEVVVRELPLELLPGELAIVKP